MSSPRARPVFPVFRLVPQASLLPTQSLTEGAPQVTLECHLWRLAPSGFSDSSITAGVPVSTMELSRRPSPAYSARVSSFSSEVLGLLFIPSHRGPGQSCSSWPVGVRPALPEAGVLLVAGLGWASSFLPSLPSEHIDTHLGPYEQGPREDEHLRGHLVEWLS